MEKGKNMTVTQTGVEYGLGYVFPGHLDENRIRQVAEEPRSYTINGNREEGVHFVIDEFKNTMNEACSPITLITGRAVKDTGVETETRSYAMPPELHGLLRKISDITTLPNEYNFPAPQDQNQIKSLAKSYKWFGEIKVDGSQIRSQRPMPPKMFQLARKNSKMRTPLLSLYQDCEDVYKKVLTEGETAFPQVYDVLLQYGFNANCVLAETMNMKETTERLGRTTAERFLRLAWGMSIQPRLFD